MLPRAFTGKHERPSEISYHKMSVVTIFQTASFHIYQTKAGFGASVFEIFAQIHSTYFFVIDQVVRVA